MNVKDVAINGIEVIQKHPFVVLGVDLLTGRQKQDLIIEGVSDMEPCMWVDIGPTGGVKMCDYHKELNEANRGGLIDFNERYCKYCLEGQKIDTANRALSNYDEIMNDE